MRFIGLLAAMALGAGAQESTYRWVRQLGGTGQESVVGVAADAAGNTWVVGSTDSPDFPLLNAIQARPGSLPLYRMDGAQGATKIAGTGVSGIAGVAFSPCDGRTVFAVSNQVLLRSADLGASWTSVALPDGYTAASIAVACGDAGTPIVYVGGGKGLLRWSDFAGWETLQLGGGVSGVWVDPNAGSTVYAGAPGGLARSTDRGDTWLSTGLTTFSLAFDPKQPGTVYAPVITHVGDTAAIAAIVPARSADFGATWTMLSALPSMDVYPLIVLPDPVRPDVLYAAGHGFFVSTDAGKSWTARASSVGPPMAVDTETNTIYAVSNSTVVATCDGFDTLTAVTQPGLPVVIALAARHGVAFAATYSTHDVYVTKLDGDGEVLFSTYFGGSHEDTPTAISTDAAGAIYVAGSTASLDFPTTNGAFQRTAAGQGAKFLFKLNADGTLAYSTYFSGSDDYGTTLEFLAVDPQGGAIIGGTTSGGVPAAAPTVAMARPRVPLPRATQAYVSKFRPDGSALEFSTYLGTGGGDSGSAMALAQDGSMYVAGRASLFHLAADGTNVLKSATTGGMQISDIRMDAAGGLIALANSYSGGRTLLRVSTDLEVSVARQLPGVTSARLAFDGAGNLLAAGGANPDLPTVAPLQSAFSPQTGFVAALAPDLSRQMFSTFAGDRHLFAVANAVAAPGGDIVFAGATQPTYSGYAPLFPFPAGPNDAGASDVYVARLTPREPAIRVDSIVNAASFAANPVAGNETLVVRGEGFGSDAKVMADGQALKILSRAGDRIVVATPGDFSADGAVRVVVESGGVKANSVLMPRAAGSPGVLSADGSGSGQAYALNADGTLNGPSNAAAEGETVTVYVNAAGGDATATVDGFHAKVAGVSAGELDIFPGALGKVNVVIPTQSDLVAFNPDLGNFKLPPKSALQVISGGVQSQVGITLSIR